MSVGQQCRTGFEQLMRWQFSLPTINGTIRGGFGFRLPSLYLSILLGLGAEKTSSDSLHGLSVVNGIARDQYRRYNTAQAPWTISGR